MRRRGLTGLLLTLALVALIVGSDPAGVAAGTVDWTGSSWADPDSRWTNPGNATGAPNGTVATKEVRRTPGALDIYTFSGASYTGNRIESLTFKYVIRTSGSMGTDSYTLWYSHNNGSTWTSLATSSTHYANLTTLSYTVNQYPVGPRDWAWGDLSSIRLRLTTTVGNDQRRNIDVDSQYFTVNYDTTPPAAPSGLSVANAGTGGALNISWSANSESDLSGYNLYRSTTSGGSYTKINGSLVTGTTYSDTGLTTGTTYYYVVRAVDTSGNESGNSAEASGTPSDTTPPAAPTGLSVANPGTGGKLNLSWNANGESDLAGYNVYRSTTSGEPYTKINGSLVTDTTYADTGLTNGTTYYYVVRAVDTTGNESGNSTEASGTPSDATAPAAPTGLTVSDPETGGKLDLSWNANSESDLTGYNVYRSTTSGGPYTKVNGSVVTGTIYQDTGLTNGTTYYYVVRAVDTTGNESANSTEASGTPTSVDTTPPDPPTGLAVSNPGTGGRLNLSWNVNSEPDLAGYNIYRSTTQGSGYTKINGSLVTGTTYADTGVTNGTTYYYVVRAVDTANNESGNSAEASGTPSDTTAPAAPTGLTVSNPGTGGALDLSWDANSESDLAGYNVYRSTTSGGSYTKLNGSLVTDTAYADTGLTDGTTYYYVVRAVDTATPSNESGNSNEASSAPSNTAPPAAPTGLTVSNPGSGNRLDLSWNANTEPDLAGYNIYRSTTSGGPYTQINGSLVTGSTYSNSGLTNGTTYYYVVRAVDTANNESGDSTQASGSPTDSTAPGAPTGLAVSDPGTGRTLNLSWNANGESDLAGYNVYRSTTSGGSYTKVNGSLVTGTNYNDTSVADGTTYYYVVRAVDTSNNESVNSNQASGSSTNTVPPAAPTGLTVSDAGTGTALDLTWTANTEPDLAGYNVYRSTASGGPYTQINGSLVTVNTYNNTGLSTGTTYYYVVRAVDTASLESGNSNQASGKPMNPSLLPPDGPYVLPFRVWLLKGSVSCDTNVSGICNYTIRWDPVPGAAEYAVHYGSGTDIMRYTASGWEWNEAGTWELVTPDTTDTQHTLALAQYYNYVVRIRALDAGGAPVMSGGKEQTGYLRVYPPDIVPHGGFAADTHQCQVCHQTHSAQAPRLMRAASATSLCLTCHNGTGSKYDVLDGQVRGRDGQGSTADGQPESPAGAFGVAGGTYDASATTYSRINSQHTIGTSLSNAPGSGGAYGGELGCISCHNPHGTSNYRILKRILNRFYITVPALSTTANVTTGAEESAYYGGYNPAANGTIVASTAGDTNTDATVTLDANAEAIDGAYTGSFIRVTKGANTYAGYIRQYTAAREATVRVIGGSTWPTMDSTFTYALKADPRSSISTLCQACHTSFALSRSGADKSGVTNDGGNAGEDTHRYRHAIGIRVYQGRKADTGPFGYPGYAIKTNALHPFDYSVNSGDSFPWVVVTENQDRSAAAFADSSATANSNRIVCLSCHVVHGTDRVGFTPVGSTNTTAPVTETVETGTARGVTSTTIQLKSSADATFPLSPRGLVVEVGAVTRKVETYDSSTRTATLDSSWSVTGTPTYTVKRRIDSINPNDSNDGLPASTTLRRRNNMGICQSCHQK